MGRDRQLSSVALRLAMVEPLEEIAPRAGVARMAVHRPLGSRDQVLVAVLLPGVAST